jgi:hypothetical protein
VRVCVCVCVCVCMYVCVCVCVFMYLYVCAHARGVRVFDIECVGALGDGGGVGREEREGGTEREEMSEGGRRWSLAPPHFPPSASKKKYC